MQVGISCGLGIVLLGAVVVVLGFVRVVALRTLETLPFAGVLTVVLAVTTASLSVLVFPLALPTIIIVFPHILPLIIPSWLLPFFIPFIMPSTMTFFSLLISSTSILFIPPRPPLFFPFPFSPAPIA